MKQVKKMASQTSTLAYLNICSTPSTLASLQPGNFATEDEIKPLWSENEIIQYHVLAVDTQEQGFSTTAFMEPIHCAPELAMFEALLSRGQEVSFAHLKLEFA